MRKILFAVVLGMVLVNIANAQDSKAPITPGWYGGFSVGNYKGPIVAFRSGHQFASGFYLGGSILGGRIEGYNTSFKVPNSRNWPTVPKYVDAYVPSENKLGVMIDLGWRY